MSDDNVHVYDEDGVQDIFISATCLNSGRPASLPLGFTSTLSNCTVYTSTEILGNTENRKKKYLNTKLSIRSSLDSGAKPFEKIKLLKTEATTSISDDEIHGSRRNNRKMEHISARSSNCSNSYEDTRSLMTTSSETETKFPKKSGIPRPVAQIKPKSEDKKSPTVFAIFSNNPKLENAKELEDKENSPKIPIKEINTPRKIQIKENNNVRKIQSKGNNNNTPKYSKSTNEVESKKVPRKVLIKKCVKKISNISVCSSTKQRWLQHYSKNPKPNNIWAKKVAGRSVILQKNIEKLPKVANLEKKPTTQEACDISDIRIIRSPTKPSSVNALTSNKIASINNNNTKKLMLLEKKYETQKIRFMSQYKEMSNVSIKLENTKKNLIIVSEQIKELGGAAALDFLDTKSIGNDFNINLRSVDQIIIEKCDGSTDTMVPYISYDLDNEDLQIQNRALLDEIDKLKKENGSKVNMLFACLKDLKTFQENTLLTESTYDEVLNKQINFNNKLSECDKNVKEFSLEMFRYKSLISKVKTELDEEKLKLELEKKNKNEIENKLREELLLESSKLKNEKIKRESMQTQLTMLKEKKEIWCNEKDEIENKIQQLEMIIDQKDKLLEGAYIKLNYLEQDLKEKDNALKSAESAITDLKEANIILENQVLEMDVDSKKSISIVEMSKQLLYKDEQIGHIKYLKDQAANENAALYDLLHFLAALNSIDITIISSEDINDASAVSEIKEKIKEAYRKPTNSSVTESLVREQAEQIQEQEVKINEFMQEIHKQSYRIDELMAALKSKEIKQEAFQVKYNDQSVETDEIVETEEPIPTNKFDTLKEVGIDDIGANSKVTIDELLTMLVAKGEAFARMESKMKQLELIHSMCARKKARGESRIAQLESILQNIPTCWEEVVLSN